MQLVAGRPSAATAPERAGERERKKKILSILLCRERERERNKQPQLDRGSDI